MPHERAPAAGAEGGTQPAPAHGAAHPPAAAHVLPETRSAPSAPAAEATVAEAADAQEAADGAAAPGADGADG